MAISSAYLSRNCSLNEQNRIHLEYDAINNDINVNACFFTITIPHSWGDPGSINSTYYIDVIPNTYCGSINKTNYSQIAGTYRTCGGTHASENSPISAWSIGGNKSLSFYRNYILPHVGNIGLYYYQQDNQIPENYIVQKYSNITVYNDVPIIPAAGTFTMSNACYNGDNSVRINITSSSSNVQYWSIQRSATSGGTYTEVGKQYPSGGTVYYDTTVDVLSTYWYKVVAHNTPWDEASAVQSIKVYVETNTPVLTGGTDISNYPDLGWSGITTSINACSGATKQNWYQKPTTGNTYTRVASLDIASGSPYSSFGLLPNVSYDIYSTFSGDSISGGETPASNIITITNTVELPSISAITTILSGCTVYNKIDIDIPNSPYADSYELWRSTTETGTYTKVGTGTTYTLYDTTPVNNTTYWYKIKAVNTYWTLFGTATSVLSVITLPIAPNLSAVLDGYDVDLTWTDSNLYQDNWEVYRKSDISYVPQYPASGLTGLYNLNQSSGTSVTGSTGANRTQTNGSWVTGYAGNGLSFGTNGYINFGTADTYARTNAFTFKFWLKRNTTASGSYYLISKGYNTGTNRGLAIYIGTDHKLYVKLFANSSKYVGVRSTTLINNTNWNTIAITYNGNGLASGVEIYINGVKETKTTILNNLGADSITNGYALLIGGYIEGTTGANSIFDNIGIWNRALTESECIDPNLNYSLIATTSTTAYSDTDIDLGYEYKYIVRAKNDCNTPIVYSPYSNEVNIAVDSIIYAPTGCTVTPLGYTGATLNWVNNNVSGVTANRILKWNGSSYDIFDTVPSGDTSYVLTNLTPNTTYRFIIQPYNLARTANSAEISFSTLDPSPYGLHTTNVNLIYTDIQWSLPAIPYGSHLEVRIKKITDSSYTTIATLNTSTTSYRLLGLIEGQEYSCAVVAIGSEYPSNIITFTVPTLVYSNAFCSGDNFIVLDATSCGVSNGVVLIPNVNYLYLYDFTLQNVDGTYYSINIDSFTNLPAGWYTLTATIKPQYSYLYFGDACVYEWIEIGDSNTNITLNSTKVKPAVCGGFGVSMGRIIYYMTDSSGATGWTFTIYDSYQNKVHQEVLTSIDTIVYLTKPGNYYSIIENNLGCTYLLDLVEVESVSLNAVPEISELYLTPWDSTIEYNYYDSSNEDWYEAGIDTLQFSSTKIKEYLNLVDYWYQIELYTAKATYSQALNRSQNGLTFSEDITITIPKADNSKWKELASILTNRYIIVFKDANDNYWTMGYRSGCTVKSYQLSTNMYTITFNSPAVTKMITAIDVNYVNNHIK